MVIGLKHTISYTELLKYKEDATTEIISTVDFSTAP